MKRRALHCTKTFRRDTEALSTVQLSRLLKFMTMLKKPFMRYFWEDVMEDMDNETLVDSKVLSYAYLEAGLIETLGA